MHTARKFFCIFQIIINDVNKTDILHVNFTQSWIFLISGIHLMQKTILVS